jgi:hypothetical protein
MTTLAILRPATWFIVGSIAVLAQAGAAMSADTRATNALLHLSLIEVKGTTSAVPCFQADLRNAGSRELVLSVGFELANKHYPEAFRLWFTDANGKAVLLLLKGPGVIGGRADAWIVHLPAQGSYKVPLCINDYDVPGEQMREGHLPPGHYKLRVELVGLDSLQQTTPSVSTGAPAQRYWVGTVESNTVAFTIAPTATL